MTNGTYQWSFDYDKRNISVVICVLGGSILPLSYDFSIGFWNWSDSLVFPFNFTQNILLAITEMCKIKVPLPKEHITVDDFR